MILTRNLTSQEKPDNVKKKLTMTSYRQIMMSSTVFKYMVDLEKFGTQSPEA